jgi:hypothetical protein
MDDVLCCVACHTPLSEEECERIPRHLFQSQGCPWLQTRGGIAFLVWGLGIGAY